VFSIAQPAPSGVLVASHWLASQRYAKPAQPPAPSQASFFVPFLPSLQAVPITLGSTAHPTPSGVELSSQALGWQV
jgi:hypothetical protein